MNDSTLITISWVSPTYVFIELDNYTICQHSLEDVLVVIQAGEEWACDNCTVTLAEVLTHDEQEMSQEECYYGGA